MSVRKASEGLPGFLAWLSEEITHLESIDLTEFGRGSYSSMQKVKAEADFYALQPEPGEVVVSLTEGEALDLQRGLAGGLPAENCETRCLCQVRRKLRLALEDSK